MARKSNAIEMLLAIMPQLTEDEKDELRESLGNVDTCDRTGHKFKFLRVTNNWFAPTQTEIFCEKCGITLVK